MGRNGQALLQPALRVAFLLQEYHPRSAKHQWYGSWYQKVRFIVIVLSKMTISDHYILCYRLRIAAFANFH